MRALVLSGGGEKGAFQVGAIQHLMIGLGRKYDIYCGVSVGAINSAYLSMYGINNGISAAKDLLKLWENLDTKKVYKRWCPFGELHVLWEKSVYNSKPLKELLRREINANKIINSGNKLRIGAVSLNTGEYKIFTESDPNIVKSVIASSAFPVMLTPAEIDGDIWMDGGARNVTPLKTAIDAGADEIDVILTFPGGVKKNYDSKNKTLKLAIRTLDIMMSEIMDNDIKIAEMINEQVRQGREDKREVKINIIRPYGFLPSKSLDFSPERLERLIVMGEIEARKFEF